MTRALNALLLALALPAAASCALLRTGNVEPEAEAVVVQVREYNRSSTVDVVAWAPEETGYGLHAMVRRDGNLVRDHRLYVSTLYLGTGFFRNASTFGPGEAFRRRRFVEMIAPHEQLLEATGLFHDAQHCYGWARCSPRQTGGARLPDSLLRASRDSLSVRFYDSAGSELIVTVRRDVIDPYLKAVDSVTAALRKN